MTAYVKTTQDSVYLPRKGSVNGTGDMNEHGSNSLAWTNNLTGATVPNWRKLVESGRSATSPMTAEEIKVENFPATFHVYGSVSATSNSSDFKRYADCTWSLGDPSVPAIAVNSIDAKALNVAQTKWNAKIFDVMTSFQGGVFLAELRQTLNLIARPGMGLRVGLSHYLLSLKKGKGMTKAQALRYLSESWLEFIFGVAPLINDVKDATTYLQTYQDKLKRELVRVIGSSGDMWVDLGHLQRSHTTYGYFRWTLVRNRGAFARYSGAIKSEAVSTYVKVLDQTGFSPRNWAPTLYEIIPWSFVIDYFSNCGTIIESWSNQSLALAWGSLTTKQLSTETMNSFVPDYTLGGALKRVFTSSSSPGSYFSQRKRVFRSVVDTIPIPGFSYKIPGFSLKWLNLAALAVARSNLTPFRI